MRGRTASLCREFDMETAQTGTNIRPVARTRPQRIITDHPDRCIQQTRINIQLNQTEAQCRAFKDIGDIRIGTGGKARPGPIVHWPRRAIFARVSAAI